MRGGPACVDGGARCPLRTPKDAVGLREQTLIVIPQRGTRSRGRLGWETDVALDLASQDGRKVRGRILLCSPDCPCALEDVLVVREDVLGMCVHVPVGVCP